MRAGKTTTAMLLDREHIRLQEGGQNMVRLYRSAANRFVMQAPDWLCTWPCTCMCINRCQVADAKQGPADTDWAVSFALRC